MSTARFNQKSFQLMATLPHSGESIPPEASWLFGLDEVTLMGDVDRYVDRLYAEALSLLKIPSIATIWHRYAADLNRLPSDVDRDSVEGVEQPAGTFPRGFHWAYSTLGVKILPQPLSKETHQALVTRVYEPFHNDVQNLSQRLLQESSILHLDLHSMPSIGTTQHRDPGENRRDVVISDSKGKSCDSLLKDLVISRFQDEGFDVAYNWPYFGGRLTETYGRPQLNHHVLQIELNRKLYMNEKTKEILPEWVSLSERLERVLAKIKSGVADGLGR